MKTRSRLALLAALTLVACDGSRAGTPDQQQDQLPIGALPAGGAVVLSPVELRQPQAVAGVGACLIVEDLDGDERPDVFFLPAVDNTVTPTTAAYVLQNKGEFMFDQVTVKLPPLVFNNACAAGDYDNDGKPDIAIAAKNAVILLHNLGGMKFEDATASSGITDGDNARDVAFIDYDLDGRLDLYVVNENLGSTDALIFDCGATSEDYQCRYEQGHDKLGAQSLLYRNLDGKTWKAQDGAGGAPDNTGVMFDGGMPNAISVLDWNHDGLPDLMVGNDFGRNRLYLNTLAHVFRDASVEIGFQLYNHAMGLAPGDFDGDGLYDLYVADLGPNQLWFGKAGGSLENRAFPWGVGEATRYDANWGPVAADFNQDGWLDVYVASSGRVSNNEEMDPLAHYAATTMAPQLDTLFVSQGAANHFAVQQFAHPRVSVPSSITALAATADLDGDGDLDVVSMYGAMPILHLRMIKNDTPGAGHYLRLRLAGGAGDSKQAIGATVTIEAAGHSQTRMMHGKAGNVAQSEGVLHFGLGAATTVAQITVMWPGGGTSSVAGPIPVDQTMTIQQ